MTNGRWSFLHPRREEGMALVLAVVTTTVITIMVVAMLSFTSASSRDASLKDAGQSAYALAEGGLSQALAQLASHYYRDDSPNPPSPYRPDGKTPINSSAAFDPSWFTGTTTSVVSPTDGSPCTARSTCMSWTATYTSAPVGIQQGTITLTGTGTVPNPTGASPVVRRLTTRLTVLKKPTLVKTPDYWKEIYTGAPPTPGVCNLLLGQGVTITAPLYVAGNLCLQQSAQIYGSNVTLKVFGWVWLQNTSTIGSSTGSPARIASALINGACSTDTGNRAPDQMTPPAPHCTVNATGGKVWDNAAPLNSPGHSADSPTSDPLPTVDWTKAQNDQNSSSPAPSCTNGRSLNEATFALTPATSYSCTTAVGSIVWNATSRVLTVDGNIWFPGNLWIDTTNIPTTYQGLGSFFVWGTISTANNAFLCVKLAGSECDFANANNTGSSGYWDATHNLLLLQAHGAVTGTNFHFQGGIYSDASITLNGGGGGTAGTQGPLISPNTITVGQQLNGSFPDFPFITSGSLGTQTPLTLQTVSGGTH
jgi:Tfp pilus assembly protein PilX